MFHMKYNILNLNFGGTMPDPIEESPLVQACIDEILFADNTDEYQEIENEYGSKDYNKAMDYLTEKENTTLKKKHDTKTTP